MRRTWLPLAAIALGSLVGVAALGAVGLGLWLARQDAFAAAEHETRNAAAGVAAEIAGTLALYDGFLRSVAAAATTGDGAALAAALSGDALMPAGGGAAVLDAGGAVVASYPPRRDCCGDPGLAAHFAREAGFSVSGPAFSVTAPGDARLFLSRAVFRPNVGRVGTVVAALRVAALRALVTKLDIGAGGRITILNGDGHVVTRHPSTDGSGDVLVQMPLPPALGYAPLPSQRSAEDGDRPADPESPSDPPAVVPRPGGVPAAPASTVGADPLGGDERLYVAVPVGQTSLVVVADRPLAEIYRPVEARAALVGGAVAALAVVTVGFAVGFRRELVGRTAAETLIDELAVTDELTNLANARRIDEVLGAEWRRAVRNRTPLAVLKVEVDSLDAIRQRYGAPTVDAVQREVARVIARSIRRPGDVAGRVTEGVFTVVLPDTAAAGAVLLGERMRVGAAAVDAGVKLRRLQVTVSVGVGWGYPDRRHEPEELVVAAERALDGARASGRDRVARVDLGERGFVLARR